MLKGPMPKLLLSLTFGLLAALSAQAQNAPANPAAGRAQAGVPAGAPARPASNCLVTEFRAIALGTHDLKERGSKAAD